MSGAAVDTCVAVDALALVDDGEGFTHRDGALWTGADTLLAADAADAAVLPGSCARPFILAAHSHRCRDRHKLEEFLRADFDALSAAVALGTVNRDDTVFQF